MGSDDFLFSEREYADFVGKSVAWVRLERRAGRGPAFIRVGRTPKYPRKAIAEWMNANCILPGGRPA